ncbi:PREDICTED: LOC110753160 [Prunus dulcis]|uniref:PREDICTED: LOC110753160 n=1 Tax=Prunus dulcis TaxID=3755 RepID=A0A5E4G8C6_PRUDU|nr:PREDICTED: LOC110753160 [Prunus dulcis]
MAWRVRGPIARNLTAEFEQSGYEGMYEEDEEDEDDGIAVDEKDKGDKGTVLSAIHVEDEGDEGTILKGINVAEDGDESTILKGINVAEDGDEGNVLDGINGVNVDEEGDEGTISDGINVDDEIIYEEGENDKRAENESEDNEDLEFYDSTYEQSEDEQCLLEKDDQAFDNYVDHNAPDIDPTVDEGEKSDDMVVSDANSLDSSSCDEVNITMRKIKRKLPKFDDFRHDTDLSNPIFKLGLRFSNVYVFRKAVRIYLVFNRRKIKFSKMIKIRLKQFVMGLRNQQSNPQLLLSCSRTPNLIFNFSLCPQQPSHQSSLMGRHFNINPYKKPTNVFPLCIQTIIFSHFIV